MGLVVGCVFWGFFQVFFCVFFPGGNEVSRNRELVRRPYLWTDSTLWVLGVEFDKVGVAVEEGRGRNFVGGDGYFFVRTYRRRTPHCQNLRLR